MTLPPPQLPPPPAPTRSTRWSTPIWIAVVVVVLGLLFARPLKAWIDGLNPPKVLLTEQLPTKVVVVGQRAEVSNPLDPGLEQATVLHVVSTATSSSLQRVVATISVCTNGTWSPDGVTGFVLGLSGGTVVFPDPSSPAPALAQGLGAKRCGTGTVAFTVPHSAKVTGVEYVELPYRKVRWSSSSKAQ